MNGDKRGALQISFKGVVLLLVVVLVGGYYVLDWWSEAARAARAQRAEKGAQQAMAEARRIADTAPQPEGWTKKTRRVTLALPLGNREEEIVYWDNPLGMTFVLIPAGEFLMGQNGSDAFPDADPEHRVRIGRPFFLGAHEVTRAQYEAITGKPTPFRQGPQLGNEPACGVTWDDAATFCRVLSQREGREYRLPTEAEWEYACRAGTTTGGYMGERDGAELCCIAYKPKEVWIAENRRPRYHPEPVDTFPANAFGLFHMAGNAWEWCQDWYAEDYYAQSPTDDPQGPPSGTSHVRRGGSFTTGRLGCFSYYRVSPKASRDPSGFRVVLANAHPSE